MQAKIKGNKVEDQLSAETNCIINLAFEEYSKVIFRHLPEEVQFITCAFGEMNGDKVIEKGTPVKMARGERVRFMAENKVKEIQGLKAFNRLGDAYEEDFSEKRSWCL